MIILLTSADFLIMVNLSREMLENCSAGHTGRGRALIISQSACELLHLPTPLPTTTTNGDASCVVSQRSDALRRSQVCRGYRLLATSQESRHYAHATNDSIPLRCTCRSTHFIDDCDYFIIHSQGVARINFYLRQGGYVFVVVSLFVC